MAVMCPKAPAAALPPGHPSANMLENGGHLKRAGKVQGTTLVAPRCSLGMARVAAEPAPDPGRALGLRISLEQPLPVFVPLDPHPQHRKVSNSYPASPRAERLQRCTSVNVLCKL